MIKTKICGIRRIEDALMLNRHKPDYAGFVFAKSRRQVTKDLAKKLRETLDKSIATVGVFVNHDMTEIEELIAEGIIDAVQFHGDETEADIVHIKEKYPSVAVIKAISVSSIADITKWQDSRADFLLLDNGAGGTGERFDWRILEGNIDLSQKYFIAGGLSPENASEIKKFSPYGADVSGGVETDGFKDEIKISKFIYEVRK